MQNGVSGTSSSLSSGISFPQITHLPYSPRCRRRTASSTRPTRASNMACRARSSSRASVSLATSAGCWSARAVSPPLSRWGTARRSLMRSTVDTSSARSRSSRSRIAFESISPPCARIGPVLPQDLSKRRSELHLLDVREQDEWDAGHIEGAQHIPLGELGARLAEVPQRQVVVAVCRSGSRSDRAADGLRLSGFEAENLDGGVTAWYRAGLALVAKAGGPGRVI